MRLPRPKWFARLFAVQVREVWSDNLEQEFLFIRKIVEEFPIVVRPRLENECQGGTVSGCALSARRDLFTCTRDAVGQASSC